MLRGLYAITDGSTGDALLSNVERALRGGAAIVQYRDKTTDAARRAEDAFALRALCHGYGALFIVNDDLALAKTVLADGVHVGREDSALNDAREYLGLAAIIGVSCYNQLPVALIAQQQGADYVAFGSFFPSPTKPQAARAALPLLEEARAQLSVPICAIGGITLQNAGLLLQNGANMLAVISDLFDAGDVDARASQYARLFAGM